MKEYYVKPTAGFFEYEAESLVCASGKHEGFDGESEFDGIEMWE